MNKPPFTLSEEILALAMSISELLGILGALKLNRPQIHLRRENTIKTIHSSLAIEGNTLSLEQVTDILDKVPVIGPKEEILEVKNAIKTYESLHLYSYQTEKSLLLAHSSMMKGLIADLGIYRQGNVGIFAGGRVSPCCTAFKTSS